jgi:hypothetical protein
LICQGFSAADKALLQSKLGHGNWATAVKKKPTELVSSVRGVLHLDALNRHGEESVRVVAEFACAGATTLYFAEEGALDIVQRVKPARARRAASAATSPRSADLECGTLDVPANSLVLMVGDVIHGTSHKIIDFRARVGECLGDA